MQTRKRTGTAWVVILTAVGSAMAALDTLVVSTALSAIRVDLGATVEQLEWTVNAYNLSFAVLLLTAAAFGDRYGRRGWYAGGLALFAVASAASALAPSVGWLIAARALQGAGAALMLTLGLALISAAFPPERRGAAIGLFSAVTGIAVASGPLVGGAIVEGIDWEWIFWLNVPIGLLAVPFVLTRIEESVGGDARLDLPGLALISAGAFGVVWALVRGNTAGWDSGEVLAALCGGVLVLCAFVTWERRARAPMLPPRLFRSRAFAAGNVVLFCLTGALFGAIFFFAQMLQTVLGYEPLGAGLRLVPFTVTFITIAPVVGRFVDRTGPRPFVIAGMALQTLAFGWIALIAEPGLTYAQFLVPSILAGAGVSLAIPSAQVAVVGSVAGPDVGKAAGANTMMRELGGVLGIAIAVALFAGAGSHASPEAFLDGFAPAIASLAALALVGALTALAIPTARPANAPDSVSVSPAQEVVS